LEGDLAAHQFSLDEMVAVEPGPDAEGEEGADAQDHGADDFIEDVEVKVGVAAAVLAHDAVIGIAGWIARVADGEGGALLHAAEDVIDPEAVLVLAAAEERLDALLFALALFGPGDGDFVVAGKGLDPALIVPGAAGQQLFAQDGMATDGAEEVDEVGLVVEIGQIAVDDDAVEAVIKPLQERLEQFNEQLHRRFALG
jgi:hypothetical protein